MHSSEQPHRSKIRLGLFGATRSGKTVYLTTLYWLSKRGLLPPGMVGLLPADRASAKYLGERYAMIEAGQWPAGNLDSQQVALDISLKSGVITLTTNDFRGGDFTIAFYSNDPATQERAEEFVRKLFHGCSAYLFLVDCGDIRAALENKSDLDSQKTATDRGGAIETTLNILRRKSWGFRVFHHPVAVVFTKGDLHPACMAEPETYAKQHLRPTWDYLQQHARANHRFFAISSTGEVPPGREGPPLPLRPAKNFFEPILWCVERNQRRVRILWRTVAAVCLVVLVGLWSVLFLRNDHQLGKVKEEIAVAQDDHLQQLYVQVQGWHGLRYLLTHPESLTRLCQEIVGEAERRVNDSLKKRETGQGNLRTVDDLQQADKLIAKFTERYPGTEATRRLRDWSTGQRQILGDQFLNDLDAAAADRNEEKFNDLMKDYPTIASPGLDTRVEQARRILDETIVADKVKNLWNRWVIDPHNVDDIRAACATAEEELKHRQSQEKHREFVQLMRNTYDQLNQNRTLKIGFRLESEFDYKVKWWFEINGDDAAKSNEWRTATKLPDGRYEIEGASVLIDLLSTRAVRVAWNLDDAYWFFGSNSKMSTPPYTLEHFSLHLQEPAELSTEDGKKYRVVFQAEDELVKYCTAVARLKELGDELFRSAR